jgi:hypothetical protein
MMNLGIGLGIGMTQAPPPSDVTVTGIVLDDNIAIVSFSGDVVTFSPDGSGEWLFVTGGGPDNPNAFALDGPRSILMSLADSLVPGSQWQVTAGGCNTATRAKRSPQRRECLPRMNY